MKPNRIAYLVSQYPAISHTFILREIRTLRHLNFEIKVASINTPDRCSEKLTEIEREETAQTYYVKRHGLIGAIKTHFYTCLTHPLKYGQGLLFALSLGRFDLKKILYCFFYFVEAVMVGQWVQKQRFQHLHVHFGMAAATVGLIAKRTFPITFSLTIHGPDEFYDTPANYLTQKILNADFVCCISYFAQSQLMMLSPPSHWHKFEVSPLGVDPARFIPRSFHQHPEPFEILCVGRLVPVKGQFILVSAVAKLVAQGRLLRLRFIGEGPDRQSLEREVKQLELTEQVIFEGAVNQEHILSFYQKADVFILASFAEGVPVVLMEAMSMEIPCITTHITGIPELIKVGEGILVAPSDVEGLVQAIIQLMDNSDLRHQLGKAGRQQVLKNYHLQVNTEKLAGIFHRRLNE